jgi:hypothetical protein
MCLFVDSASNRNEYQEFFLGSEGSLCVGLALPPSCADCLEIRETQPPGTLRAYPCLYGIVLLVHWVSSALRHLILSCIHDYWLADEKLKSVPAVVLSVENHGIVQMTLFLFLAGRPPLHISLSIFSLHTLDTLKIPKIRPRSPYLSQFISDIPHILHSVVHTVER